MPTKETPGHRLFCSLFALLVTTLLLGAGSALAGEQADASLKSFAPPPADITLQRSEEAPRLGNTRVEVRLDGEGVERLARETGRTDFMLLGPERRGTVLRDDGVFPDTKKADQVFTGFAHFDLGELKKRGERDAARAEKRPIKLTMKDRQIVDAVQTRPFSFSAFEAGKPVALGPPVGTLLTTTPGFTTAFQDKVLMITDPGVVGDPTRTIDPCSPPPSGSPLPAWSFGRLMTDMANPGLTGINPSQFVEDWLNHWLVNQTINTFGVSARPLMNNLLADWHAASPGPDLDLTKAPMRLIAIVNRTDLRETTTGGGGYLGSSGTNFLNAGEGRFVFAVVDPFGGGCQETPFTVILEYGVPLSSCPAVKQWALDWSALDSLILGSPAYNNALQNLTDVFAAPNAAPSKPNGSAINQVRTNENELNPLWELREFRLLDPTPSLLSQTTVAETPDDVFRPSNEVNTYISPGGNPRPMPLNHPVTGNPFLGGASENPFPPSGTFWDGIPSMPGPASGRHDFSFNTCNGCHGGETDTFFVHINPAPNGVLSFLPLLSDFLIGANVTDPVDGTVRFFDDLDRREDDLAVVAGMICSLVVPIHHELVAFELQNTGVLPPNPFGENDLATAAPNDLGLDEIFSTPVQQSH